MIDRKTFLGLIFIIILAFFAGNFVNPTYLNQGIDFTNQKLHLHLPHFWDKPFNLGLDLQGGVRLIYEADLSKVKEANKEKKMSQLRDVIERRINIYGVTEPLIQVKGQNRLIVELAGIKDVSSAVEMIGETPYLEFLEMRSKEKTQEILDKKKELGGKTADQYKEVESWELAFQNPYFKPTELTGEFLESAELRFDETTYQPRINLIFNDKGDNLFEEITERNVGKPLAINLDGRSIIDTTGDGKITGEDRYAPVVQEKITGGEAIITGDMNVERARTIVSRLNSGALPVKIGDPISQKTVGPTLGEISLRKSLIAGMLGFAAIIWFMIFFYRLPGLLASFSLGIYVVLVLSLFKLIPVTLTLAGIGGFILSIGMAVDANILIFSRFHEEMKREGSFSLAVRDAFRRAWPSIRDGNLTTLLVGVILFFFGTSFIKGFALTLSLGIVVSMFSALVITKTFLKIFIGTKIEKWKFFWK